MNSLKGMHAKRVKILFYIAVALAILHFIFVAASMYAPYSTLAGGVHWFDLDLEFNIPTYYDGLLLASCASLAFMLVPGIKAQRERIWWILCGFGFFLLALDETTLIHEQFAEPLRVLLQFSDTSIFYHAWVVLAVIIAATAGFYLLFVDKKMKLDPSQRSVITLLLYLITGTVLFEILGTRAYWHMVIYRFLMVPAEEIFEISMASMILLRLFQKYESKKQS